MSAKILKSQQRSRQQLTEHYEIEKELAGRLKDAQPVERRRSYSTVYDELLRRVPHHPQWTLISDPEETQKKVQRQLRVLRRYLSRDSVFLEVGAGDCALAIEVARQARRVYAVDVSTRLTENTCFPNDFELVISDGVSIPVPENSVSIAYSYQCMEHLHPEDAVEQLRNIYKALAPGGNYLCITPNRLAGPHDISKYFDETASGFHLKEYNGAELLELFRMVGFSKIHPYVGGRGALRWVPIRAYETVLSRLPHPARRRIVAWLPFGVLWDIAIVGTK
ncbi:MAG: methyltransferase domain-containing protein [Candidatus Binatia bacterium]